MASPQTAQTVLSRRSLLKVTGLTAAAAGLVSVAGCAPGASSATAAPKVAAPRKGGTLVYAAAADIATLDPQNIGDNVSAAASIMIHEGLTRQNAALAYEPSLALSWEASGLTRPSPQG